MKSPEAVLRNALLTTTAVSSVVGTRVFPVLAPTTAALPFITYRRTGIRRAQTLSGPMGVPQVSVDLDVYAATYEVLAILPTAAAPFWMATGAVSTIQR